MARALERPPDRRKVLTRGAPTARRTTIGSDALTDVRPAAVAGMFYPEAPSALAVGGACAPRGRRSSTGRPARGVPKAIIVPHAGYVYSGPIAASAYARLAAGRDTIRRVVLFGPDAPRAGARARVAFGRGVRDAAGRRGRRSRRGRLALTLPPGLHERCRARARALARSAAAVPAGGPRRPSASCRSPSATRRRSRSAKSSICCGAGAETLIVVSSDLSHYHRYADARRIDRATGDAILALSATLDHDAGMRRDADQRAAPGGAASRAASRELLDLRNSGDTAGDKSRVVGYASFAFTEPEPAEAVVMTDADLGRALLDDRAFGDRRGARHWAPSPTSAHAALARARRPRSSRCGRSGELRGCIGSLEPPAPARRRRPRECRSPPRSATRASRRSTRAEFEAHVDRSVAVVGRRAPGRPG